MTLDVTQNCPDHGPSQSRDSKYDNQHRWCAAEGCGWKWSSFFNERPDGGADKVDKWSYHGAWYTKPDYLNAVQGTG
jgi:hypothetical protein